MATITGLTAERMLAIEAATVVDGDVVGDSLILTKHDGSTVNAGSVRGPAGPPGPISADQSLIALWPVYDVGAPVQVRAGRQLVATDFTTLGLGAPAGLWNLSDLGDISGNGRPLLNKGAVDFATGINGFATTSARFSGSGGQALYIPDTGSGDPFRIKTGSLGGWFKTARRNTDQALISKWNSTGNQRGYLLEINSANNAAAFVYSFDGAAVGIVSGLTDICDGRWHFIVVTCDGSMIRLYVDGSLEGFVLATGTLFGSTVALNIGAANADAATPAAIPQFGQADEVFMTPDVLAEWQMRNLYAAKIPHTLGVAPNRVTVNVAKGRKGKAYTFGDFSTPPLRLHNFSGGLLGDEGSNGTALTNNGAVGAVAGADGLANNAVHFAGAQNLSATDVGLPTGTAVRTYGCWFKTSSVNGTLVAWGTQATADTKIYITNVGSIATANAGDVVIGPFVADGQWHQAIVVEDDTAFDGVKRKLYLDGRLVGGSTILNSIGGAGAQPRFRIAANPDVSNLFTGDIDGVFVSGQALTAEAVGVFNAKISQQSPKTPKNPGDHVEAITSTAILAIFDTMENSDMISMGVAP